MRRYENSMNGEKFLADTQNNILHNLDLERKECCIDTVLTKRSELPFKSLETAFNHRNYKPCKYCFVHAMEFQLGE